MRPWWRGCGGRLHRDRPHQYDRIRLFRLGINPHFGTPKGTWRREVGHVPGGSSSVRRSRSPTGWRMVRSAPIPADRAGSRRPITASSVQATSGGCRWPEACRCRSRSTASGRWRETAACCAVLAGAGRLNRSRRCRPRPIKGMRLACRPRWRSTISMMRWRGASSVRCRLVAPGRADRADRGARISRRRRDEHQGWFCRGGKLCLASLSDRQQGRCLRPPVSMRILRGESISAADYHRSHVARKSLIARAAARLAPYDALVMPTTAKHAAADRRFSPTTRPLPERICDRCATAP